MKYLFPLICLAYASIFFAFSYFWGNFTASIFPGMVYNSIIFILFAVTFLIFFSDIWKTIFKKWEDTQVKKKKDKEYYKQYLKSIILNYSHYLSYIFFYLWVFIVTSFLPWIYFSYCFLAANIFVILFFLSFKHLSFAFDFLRINQIIFSLIYVWSYVYILFTWNNFFWFIDFVNSFIIILSFLFILKLLPVLKKDNFFILNFYTYVYAFIMFYVSFIFENTYIFLTVSNIFLSLWIISLSQYLSNDKINTRSMRLFWVILWYIGCVAWTLYLTKFWYNIFIYVALIVGIISNFLFHIRYQNYVSYLFSIVIFSVLLFVPSFWNIDGVYNFIFVLFLSYFLVWISFFYSEFHSYDSYFLHFLSYIYNAAWITLFFVFYSPNFIQVALLMFVEFLYFFLSYYKLSYQSGLLKTQKNLE